MGAGEFGSLSLEYSKTLRTLFRISFNALVAISIDDTLLG